MMHRDIEKRIKCQKLGGWRFLKDGSDKGRGETAVRWRNIGSIFHLKKRDAKSVRRYSGGGAMSIIEHFSHLMELKAKASARRQSTTSPI